MERMQSFHSHPLGRVGWVARAVQVLSAIVVLGIIAWATRDTKTVTVIFTLVIAVLTLVVVACSTSISCIARRNKWHILVLILTDAALSYLWLTSFVFLALDFNRISCRVIRWNGETVCSRKYTAEAFAFIAFFTTLMGLTLEVFYVYYARPRAIQKEEVPHEHHLARNLDEAGLM
ncbi:hypothetical protein N7532_009263 [Penicillium argentinense]|uniref:MARVEL domain-containing protein n=1 Tax=Penicillium argentinense TaxID=1131581 RepID=A0A9W9EZ63_9EURO|nr:uncharacterized protein N7532_009263 [Penicillium argentinense]KAJ5090579.1 hypothetical protein N7532_009263 [Penicillium argentinense]